MAEHFTLEDRLLLARLIQAGPQSTADIVAHFRRREYSGPDAVPDNLTRHTSVGALLVDLGDGEGLLVQRADGRWEPKPFVQELLALGEVVRLHGLLGVLHG